MTDKIWLIDIDINENNWVNDFLTSNQEPFVSELQNKITAVYFLIKLDRLASTSINELDKLSKSFIQGLLTANNIKSVNQITDLYNLSTVFNELNLLDDSELITTSKALVNQTNASIYKIVMNNLNNVSSLLSTADLLKIYLESRKDLAYYGSLAYVKIENDIEAMNYVKNILTTYGFQFSNQWENVLLIYKAIIRTGDWKTFKSSQIINHLPNGDIIHDKFNLIYNLGYKSYLPPTFPIDINDETLGETWRNFNPDFDFYDNNLYILKSSKTSGGDNITLHQHLLETENSDDSLQTLTNQFKDPKYDRYVIQKYIENPKLYNGNKFHVRVLLFAYNDNIYIHKNPYIMISNYKYNKDDIDNLKIHITNIAQQDYGTLEFLNDAFPNNDYFSKIVEIFQDVFKTVNIFYIDENIFTENNIPSTLFEFYGADLIIDENDQIYLIEININPTLNIEVNDKSNHPVIKENINVLNDILSNVLQQTDLTTLIPLY